MCDYNNNNDYHMWTQSLCAHNLIQTIHSQLVTELLTIQRMLTVIVKLLSLLITTVKLTMSENHLASYAVVKPNEYT